MEPESKLKTSDNYDKYISTELPDKEKYPELHMLVCKYMMHGPCGILNKNSSCMVE
jgi:hypothetical protein